MPVKKFVIARDVDDRHRPVGEELYSGRAVVNVTGKNEKLSPGRRSNEPLASEVWGDSF
ncbi:Uncharacterised protein [Burkholderia pseudomallei]|nr:Uncharacterised protein [Burkholderia pseudomallei]